MHCIYIIYTLWVVLYGTYTNTSLSSIFTFSSHTHLKIIIRFHVVLYQKAIFCGLPKMCPFHWWCRLYCIGSGSWHDTLLLSAFLTSYVRPQFRFCFISLCVWVWVPVCQCVCACVCPRETVGIRSTHNANILSLNGENKWKRMVYINEAHQKIYI